jgi:hypothetical protein
MKARCCKAEDAWEQLLEELPPGWDTYAVECGAVQRMRGVADIKTLLRVLMIHICGGVSLRTTSALARSVGWAQMSDVALWKRLRAAEPWLQELVAVWLKSEHGVLDGRRTHIVDGTTVTEPGKTGSTWRIHYRFALPDCTCQEVLITDVHQGERLARFHLPPGEWVVADSGYCHPEQLALGMDAGSIMLTRIPWRLPIYDAQHAVVDLLSRARTVAPLERREWPGVIRVKKREGRSERWLAGRLCIMRMSEAVAARQRTALRRRHQHKHGRPPQPQTFEAAGYLMLWTTARHADLGEIFRRYRTRWQVELAFKRLKSLVAISALPKHDETSVRAWLYGKLLVALWVERLRDRAQRFSPWGTPPAHALVAACGDAQSVARMASALGSDQAGSDAEDDN